MEFNAAPPQFKVQSSTGLRPVQRLKAENLKLEP